MSKPTESDWIQAFGHLQAAVHPSLLVNADDPAWMAAECAAEVARLRAEVEQARNIAAHVHDRATKLQAENATLRAERDAALRERDAHKKWAEEHIAKLTPLDRETAALALARAESAALRSRLEEAVWAVRALRDVASGGPALTKAENIRVLDWLAASGPKEGSR